MRVWKKRLVPGAAALYWSLYAAFQLRWSLTTRVDYYDALEFLRNARRLAGDQVGYSPTRPPMLPLLHAPLQAILDLARAPLAARLIAPHLLQDAVGAALLWCLYRYLRPRAGPAWAQAATILFSLNRMTLHYFGSVLADLPCALFLLLFLLARRRKPGPTLLSGAALTACLLCRWNAALLAAAVLAGLALDGRDRRQLLGAAVTAAAAGVAAALTVVALYHRVFALAWPAAASGAGRDFLSALRDVGGYHDPARLYVAAVIASSGLLLPLAFFAGAAESGRFDGVVFLSFAGAMAVLIHYKEARYLVPVLPFLYAAGAIGLKRLWDAIPPASALRPTFAAAVAAAALWPAAREAAALRDGAVYGNPVLLQTASLVARQAGAHRVFWEGQAYSDYSRDRTFVAGDRFYYVYHVPSPVALGYLTGRTIWRAGGAPQSDGDLLVKAPRRVFISGEEALPAGEDRVEVYRLSGQGPALLASYPSPAS